MGSPMLSLHCQISGQKGGLGGDSVEGQVLPVCHQDSRSRGPGHRLLRPPACTPGSGQQGCVVTPAEAKGWAALQCGHWEGEGGRPHVRFS